MPLPSLIGLKATAIATGVAFLLGGAATGYAAYRWHNDRVDSLEASWKKACDASTLAAVQAEQKTCADHKAITEGASHAINSSRDAACSRYLRLLDTTRTRPLSAATGAVGSDDATGADLSAVQSRGQGEDMVRFLGEAGYLNDIQAGQLIAAQTWIKGVCDANPGQCWPADAR